MYYYRVFLDGQESLQTRTHKCYGEEFTELTEKEYQQERERFGLIQNEQTQNETPTYEDLELENERLCFEIEKLVEQGIITEEQKNEILNKK